MQQNGKRWLIAGGIISIMVGLLHIAIVFYGAPAYRYFGAGEEMATMAESGSFMPALVTLCIAAIFILWGIYAFSGAGIIRRFPLMRLSLVTIGSIYTLRGMIVVIEIVWIVGSYQPVPTNEIVFSFVSLVIGIVYLIGTKLRWEDLKKSSQPIT